MNIEKFSQNCHHPKSTSPIAANWIFLCDTLNFCFWTADNKPKWTVNGHTGYFGLCAAINRALAEGIDLTNPRYYATITKDNLEAILRPDDGVTNVQLIDERVNCLREIGTKLLAKYDGNFENVIRAANKSAQTLVKLVVDEFANFRDGAVYNGETVTIYKRAQILVGDIWACYHGQTFGEFNDIDTITMFADYRVPQTLIHYKTMDYSERLMKMLRAGQLLENGSAEEVEIRGASIYIVEQLKERILRELHANHPAVSTVHINSILLDHFLWDYRRDNAKELEWIPFHKTISIYY